PALFKRIGDRFSNAVRSFAESNGIPVLHLNTPDRSSWDDRKVDHVRDYVNNATQPGVVAIVVAQEVQKVFMGHRRRPKTDGPQFGFDKADRRGTGDYFSLLDPARLQAICNRLTSAKLQAFFNYWIARIPCPLTRADRQAGYWWQLSMRQLEVSRTLVLDAPRRTRALFEALVADNIGIGRP